MRDEAVIGLQCLHNRATRHGLILHNPLSQAAAEHCCASLLSRTMINHTLLVLVGFATTTTACGNARVSCASPYPAPLTRIPPGCISARALALRSEPFAC
jgi:hypothetical protein